MGVPHVLREPSDSQCFLFFFEMGAACTIIVQRILVAVYSNLCSPTFISARRRYQRGSLDCILCRSHNIYFLCGLGPLSCVRGPVVTLARILHTQVSSERLRLFSVYSVYSVTFVVRVACQN